MVEIKLRTDVAQSKQFAASCLSGQTDSLLNDLCMGLPPRTVPTVAKSVSPLYYSAQGDQAISGRTHRVSPTYFQIET